MPPRTGALIIGCVVALHLFSVDVAVGMPIASDCINPPLDQGCSAVSVYARCAQLRCMKNNYPDYRSREREEEWQLLNCDAVEQKACKCDIREGLWDFLSCVFEVTWGSTIHATPQYHNYPQARVASEPDSLLKPEEK